MSITLNGTTGIIADSPATVKANAFLDAAGGNTATINGKLPIAIGDVPAGGTGLTLLGTLATTSGSSVTLSGLTLTSYKQLQFFYENVSSTATVAKLRLNGWNIADLNVGAVTDYATGGGIIDLATSISFSSYLIVYASAPQGAGYGGGSSSGLTTASTSITFTTSAGTFDAGSIKIYGVK